MITAKDCNQEPWGLSLLLLRAQWEGKPVYIQGGGGALQMQWNLRKGHWGCFLSTHTGENIRERAFTPSDSYCVRAWALSQQSHSPEAGSILHILPVSRASQSASSPSAQGHKANEQQSSI